MTQAAPLLVTLTVPQLRELVGEAVRDALAEQRPPESDWMTSADVCEHAHISPSRLDKCVREGLPVHRIGTARRFRRGEVDSWFGGRRLRAVR
jgi:hypothetical protein